MSKEVIRRMTREIKHRGPDGEGFYLNDSRQGPISSHGYSVALGHARLKVIDLVSGDQPMSNENGMIWVVLNGEIYNYLELKRDLLARGHAFRTNSDTEVIVHAYEEYGLQCVEYFRGMFAFAVWDESLNRCMLARDRMGKKPLVYSLVDGQLIFASQISALLRHPDIEKEVDYEALHHYFTYLCVPFPFTAFKQIRKVPPAHYLVFQNAGIELARYWDVDFHLKLRLDSLEALTEVERLLEESVKLRLRTDVPFGVFLSGGMDSSTVTGIAARLSPDRIKTFSIGFENSAYNELPYARIVAKYFNTEHHEEIVRPNTIEAIHALAVLYGEPFADSSALPSYYLSRMAKKNVSVVLNGDGGDEVFGGYYRFLAMRLADTYCGLPVWLRKNIIPFLAGLLPELSVGGNKRLSFRRFLNCASDPRSARWLRWTGLFSEDKKRSLYASFMAEATRKYNSDWLLEDLFLDSGGLNGVDAAMSVDTRFYLPNDLLVKMDIATMAFGLEARSPLLDHVLVEFMASLPASVKINGTTLKFLLKKIQRKILPAVILKRHKQGFAVPLGSWFRGDLRSWVKDVLLSPQALKRGIFVPDRIKGLLDAHEKGAGDYEHEIWSLVMLEIWFEQVVDKPYYVE